MKLPPTPRGPEERRSSTRDKLKSCFQERMKASGVGTITTQDLIKAHEELVKETGSAVEAAADIRQAMIEYYRSPEGLQEIHNAPQWLQEKSVEEIVDLLMSSVTPKG